MIGVAKSTPSVLLVEDDLPTQRALAEWFGGRSYRPTVASSLHDVRTEFLSDRFDLALLDLNLPDGSGLELIADLPSSTRVICMTGDPEADRVVAALRAGARDFLIKPLDLSYLDKIVAPGTRTVESPPRSGSLGPILGSSPKMESLFRTLGRAAQSDATVLITGETGTGKELVARQVHELSPRKGARFEAINCGALSPTMIESELFGHERGAFTGAAKRHSGAFERADGGTLFLDEITEMPTESQVKLLRVLELHEIQRVGGTRPFDIDVRIVAACNRAPAKAVADGKLREDLFYRLCVLHLELPPLRERPGDISILAEAFVGELNRQVEETKELTPQAAAVLEGHSWPGNVRELRNTVQRGHLLSEHSRILAEDIVILDCAARSRGDSPTGIAVGMSLAEAERHLLLKTLESTGGDKRRCAEVLGVSLKTIYNRLNLYAARLHSD